MKLGKQGKYETHPAADAFPLMAAEQLQELADDIKRNGQREPIWLDGEGRVLDGRNRILACELAGVEVRTRSCEPEDLHEALCFVWSLNGQRRHASEGALAIAATRLATLKQGQRNTRQAAGAKRAITQADAAKLTGASERSTQRAKQIEQRGVPELVAAVERGDISLEAGAELAKQPKAKQREALEQLASGSKAINGRTVRALAGAAAANEDQAPDPVVLLLRAIHGGVQRAGARVEHLDAHGLRIAFRGRVFVVQVLDGAGAVQPSRSVKAVGARGLDGRQVYDVSTAEMLDAMKHLPDSTVFRWFQQSHPNQQGGADADDTLQLTLGTIRAEVLR